MTTKVFASSISADFKAKIDHELAGEHKLWAGRPSASLAMKAGLGIWLFAIPWTAFTLFWETMAIGAYVSGAKGAKGWGGIVMILWGLPFIAVGLAMMSAPLYMWYRARQTLYVLTERRLVRFIAQRGAINVQSTWPRDIATIERTERTDGSGDLKLSYGSKRDSDGDLVEKAETIVGVGAVRDLERLMLKMKSDAGQFRA
jgi:hypothetical protein